MTVFIIAVIATVYRHRHLTLAGRIPSAPVYRRHVRTGTAYLIK